MTTSSHATTADEVKAAVVHDLDGQSRICSLHDLLKLLGQPLTDSEVDEVLGSLSDHYTQQTGWKGLPEKAGGPETAYYTPLAAIFNAITKEAVRKVNERAPESPITRSASLRYGFRSATGTASIEVHRDAIYYREPMRQLL